MAIIAMLVVYGVLSVKKDRTGKIDKDAVERNVARNAQYPQLVAGLWPTKPLDRICPVGAAQFTAGDYSCNFCHHLGEAMQNFSDSTHPYTNIAGKVSPGPYDTRNFGQTAIAQPQATEPLSELQPQAMIPNNIAQAPPIPWGAKSPHVKRKRCTNCHKILETQSRGAVR